MVAAAIAVATLVMVLAAEAWHARRCRRVAHLAFGPTGAPRPWTRLAAWLRAGSLAALAWGLTALLNVPPKVHSQQVAATDNFHRILLLLDVSPSMQLEDAGPALSMRRSERAAVLIESIMDRILLDQVRFSVVAFYTGAKTAVVDTRDARVVENILRDLPLEYVFDNGKTELFAGLQEAATLAKDWPDGNATLIVVTDGDTVPGTGTPDLPSSIGQVLVLGVGNPLRGQFIDGHQSRQERRILRQIARRLGGSYHDGNRNHVPSELLASLAMPITETESQAWGRREAALCAISVASILFALLPLALDIGGRPPQG